MAQQGNNDEMKEVQEKMNDMSMTPGLEFNKQMAKTFADGALFKQLAMDRMKVHGPKWDKLDKQTIELIGDVKENDLFLTRTVADDKIERWAKRAAKTIGGKFSDEHREKLEDCFVEASFSDKSASDLLLHFNDGKTIYYLVFLLMSVRVIEDKKEKTTFIYATSERKLNKDDKKLNALDGVRENLVSGTIYRLCSKVRSWLP